QVAQWINSRGNKDKLIVTPTAGAAREICKHLENNVGVSFPFTQPMQALLPERDNLATPAERSLAWAKAILQSKSQDLKKIFWTKKPESISELLKCGRKLSSLCDELAEAGLNPKKLWQSHFKQDCYDSDRWSAICRLYEYYKNFLKHWQLCDPNTLRLEQISKPERKIKNIIIASLPDLPRAFELYAQKLEDKGTKVDVLVWNPANENQDYFDSWGRPIPKIWKDLPLNIKEEQILVSKSARDEAYVAAKFTLEAPTSLVLADSKISGLISSELAAKGRNAYLPEGRLLTNCEASKIALNWEDFRHTKDLRRLRRLLELPAFCKILNAKKSISQTDALVAIDHLLGKSIVDTFDLAWETSKALNKEAKLDKQNIISKVHLLLGCVQKQINKSALELIEIAFVDNDMPSSYSSKRVIEIGRQLVSSLAFKDWKESQNIPSQLWSQALYGERSQEPPNEGLIILNGWLEAPWLCQERMILCGLIEGKIPQTIDGDAFLPDSVRSKLGLRDNSQRYARDAYLLGALIASYPIKKLQLSYSKYDSSGDPNKASRLLLSTNLEKLPSRVQFLSQPNVTKNIILHRHTNWRWKLPKDLPVIKKISPTQFESYLLCPFRFCIEKVLLCQSAPMASHEMDAAAFGKLIHQVLENFGREIIPMGKAMLELDEDSISKRAQELLNQVVHVKFGKHPAPAVQIQIANALVRIQAFARVQAKCFSEGWVILDVERKLKETDKNFLNIGPLRLTGIIDRIEQNIYTDTLRVLDYKTFSSVKKPVQTHLAPISQNWFPLAKIQDCVDHKFNNKTWINLQLPLYRKIVEHWYSNEFLENKVELAYFALPSDPNESGIYAFGELSNELYHSAIECAEAIAENVVKAVFWPPRPFRSSWEDPVKSLFINGLPENSIDEE
ncbi:MAG: PD-(D/E)XK nuclease family protein, partial [Verrucomicrobiota bacterium]|nr:PD-(D/E)XK nuclease family protein [Verrucomicrobiota bacterium]